MFDLDCKQNVIDVRRAPTRRARALMRGTGQQWQRRARRLAQQAPDAAATDAQLTPPVGRAPSALARPPAHVAAAARRQGVMRARTELETLQHNINEFEQQRVRPPAAARRAAPRAGDQRSRAGATGVARRRKRRRARPARRVVSRCASASPGRRRSRRRRADSQMTSDERAALELEMEVRAADSRPTPRVGLTAPARRTASSPRPPTLRCTLR